MPSDAAFISIVLGLVVGSFLTVVVHRLPAKLGLVGADPHDESSCDTTPIQAPGLLRPRSHCPKCRVSLSWHENIPLVSFVLQHGRCRHCGVRVSWRYPIIESITALVSFLVVFALGTEWQTLAALAFSWALIALAFIDIDHYLLPDAITLPLLWAGLLVNCFSGFVHPAAAVIGAAAGYLVLWLLFHLYRLITSREGFGYGDFKMLAAVGAWLGWAWLPLVLFIAATVGAVTGALTLLLKRDGSGRILPFGPFLSLAAIIVLLFGEHLISTYISLSGHGY